MEMMLAISWRTRRACCGGLPQGREGGGGVLPVGDFVFLLRCASSVALAFPFFGICAFSLVMRPRIAQNRFFRLNPDHQMAFLKYLAQDANRCRTLSRASRALPSLASSGISRASP